MTMRCLPAVEEEGIIIKKIKNIIKYVIIIMNNKNNRQTREKCLFNVLVRVIILVQL